MSLTKVSYSLIYGSPTNVLDFGADRTGVTDSTASFLAASNAAINGGIIVIPSGTYLINNLTTNRAHTWQGEGMQATTIKTTSSNACFILTINDPTWDLQAVFNDMTLIGLLEQKQPLVFNWEVQLLTILQAELNVIELNF